MIRNNIYIKNIFWLITDRVILIVGGFIVTTVIARYLGKEDLGILSYGMVLSGFCTVISQWGANYTIFNTSVKNKLRSRLFIQETELLRIILYITCWVFISVFLFISHEDINQAYIVSAICLSNIFISMDIYQFYFNATLQSKINTRITLVSKSTSMLTKLLIVIWDLPILAFIIPFVLEGVLQYRLKRNRLIVLASCAPSSRVLYLKSYLNQGVPLVITGVMIYIYTQSSQLMLKEFTSLSDVGIYYIAMTLSLAWIFIPASIGISLITKSIKNTERKDSIIFFSSSQFLAIISSLPILIVIYYFSYEIVLYSFGPEFTSASEILFVVSIGTLLSSLGFITNRQITKLKSGRNYLLKKVIISSMMSLFISYQLTRSFGLIGAAYSFMIIEFINLTLLNWFYDNSFVFKSQLKIFDIKSQVECMKRYSIL